MPSAEDTTHWIRQRQPTEIAQSDTLNQLEQTTESAYESWLHYRQTATSDDDALVRRFRAEVLEWWDDSIAEIAVNPAI